MFISINFYRRYVYASLGTYILLVNNFEDPITFIDQHFRDPVARDS